MSTELTTTSGLPLSTALSEANPAESLSELFSRDPEGYSRQDRDRVVATLRAQRVKFEASEAAGKTKSLTQPKMTALPKAPKSLESKVDAEDLGL